METTFWSVGLRQAWDAAAVVPEDQRPLLPSFSEDRGPWPLPFYPALGVFTSDSGDRHEQPLQVLVDDIVEICRRTDSCGIHSTLEPGMTDSVSPFHVVHQEKPGTPRTLEDPAGEPTTVARQHWTCSIAPHGGDEARDAEICDRSISGQCQGPVSRDWRRRLWVLPRLMEGFRCLLCCLLRGCGLRAFGKQGP